MADLEIVGFDAVAEELEAPQGADRYIAKNDMHLEQPLTTDSTVDGRDIAADGAVVDLLTVTLAVDLDSFKTKLDWITVTQAVDLDVIEARVNALDASVVLMGNWDASAGLFPTSTDAGESWIVSVLGTVDGVDFEVGDRIVAIVDGANNAVYAANWLHLDYTDKVTSVATRTGAIVLVEADITDLQAYMLPADIDSLAKLNVLVVGTTLIDTGDARLSDARTPVAHSHTDALNTGVTAFATGGQANAVQLNLGINEVSVCATDGDSVKLPEAVGGQECIIINNGAAMLAIFPAVNDQIGIEAVNASVQVAPNSTLVVKDWNAVNWVQT